MVTFGIQSTSRRIGWSDVAPTSGSHTKGTIIFNTNPTVGGNIGWVCTTNGNPGTWKAFGNIEN